MVTNYGRSVTSRARPPLLLLALVVVASACQWPSLRGDNANTGFNRSESELGLDDAGTATQLFSADLGTFGDGWQAPVISGSQIFAPSATGVAAYDLNGVQGCGGTPTTCQPRWRGDVGARQIATAPTATGTTLYVVAGLVASDSHTLFAFDVRGEQGCSGIPVVCQPLWTAPDVQWAPPVVEGDTLYAATTNGRIAAYDADGTTGCAGSPKVCQPLWTTSGSGANSSPVAVADGTLFHTTWEGKVVAYDAAGVERCSGSPKLCSPLWWGLTGGEPAAWPTSPVVSDGRVFVTMDDTDDIGLPFPEPHTIVVGFPLDGGDDDHCFGPPGSVVCYPDWSARFEGTTGSNEMAAAYGSLYVPSVASASPWHSDLVALDTDDPACVPGPCAPAWTSPSGPDAGLASPIVANDTVFVDARDGVKAVDAHGAIGCSGTPKVCSPVTFGPLTDVSSTGWGLANGKLAMLTDAPASGGARFTLRVVG
jgi:hypothetical protein